MNVWIRGIVIPEPAESVLRMQSSADDCSRCVADLQLKKLSDPDPMAAFGLLHRANGRFGEASPVAGHGRELPVDGGGYFPTLLDSHGGTGS